jgi:hypothetical protein
MEKINRAKLAKIETYLHDQEIWHESIDVQEQPIGDILVQYGIVDQLTAEEKKYLRSYLLRRAEQVEFAEAARWVDESEEPLLALIPDRLVPGQRLLDLQYKMIMAELKIEKAEEEDPFTPGIGLVEIECGVIENLLLIWQSFYMVCFSFKGVTIPSPFFE